MKTDRLLAITMYLLSRERVSASALAKRFEVSRRTIQRDIDALSMAGIPITSTQGKEGGYEILDGFRPVKQLANAQDYVHMMIALRALSSATGDAHVAETLDKLRAATDGGQQHMYLELETAREGRDTDAYLRLIDSAIREKHALQIVYSDAEGEQSARVVDPLALTYRWYAWYLFAFCRLRGDFRLFKLRRIVSLAVTREPQLRPYGDAEVLMRAHEPQDNLPYYDIKIRCRASVRQQATEYIGDHIIEEYPDGSFILSIHPPKRERMWLALLLSFGADVEVVEPEEVRTLLLRKAMEITGLYEPSVSARRRCLPRPAPRSRS